MGKSKVKINIGDVFEFQLPNNKYAYGRFFNDADVGFYKTISDIPNNPPIGSRDYFFILGFQSGVIEYEQRFPIVGNDPFENIEDAWGPPKYIEEIKDRYYSLYHKGKMINNVKKEDCIGLEKTGIYTIEEVIARIMKELTQ